jgi:hypothetical protein
VQIMHKVDSRLKISHIGRAGHHTTAWRRTAPWSSDAQVEQDLVISRALVEIYSDAVLSSSLAFRGGAGRKRP